jgi:hypothetical protein
MGMKRVKTTVGLAALACACSALVPSAAAAFSPFLIVPDRAAAEASPAYRYANMTDAEALAELARRGVLFERQGEVPGVRAPVRLTGRLHGVHVHSSLPPEQRVRSPFEILDARLALALDDFCALLEKHDVDELVHYTMYRPGAPNLATVPNAPSPSTRSRSAPSPGSRPSTPSGARSAKAHAHPHGTRHGAPSVVARREVTSPGLAVVQTTNVATPGTRHPAGLAIDVARLHKRDGRWLSVEQDFHGRLGTPTCGEGAAVPAAPEARELRAFVCESLVRRTFTYVLTPSYNAEHRDHFHMEIKPGVHWFLYH